MHRSLDRVSRTRHAAIPQGQDQRGLTLVEILVGMAIMAVASGTIAILVGAAIQSKTITSSRSADTETARVTLAWMADRLRNAGLNLQPSVQAQLRCKDRVVAQDASLLPTANSMYVSGEILKTNTVAGSEDLTIGYYLGTDAGTGNQVVIEYKQPCTSGATSIATYSTRLSNPKLNVTSLTFQYFDASGTVITNLTSAAQIRTIAAVQFSLTVQGSEGKSGVQTQTFTRSVMLWNPEPNANNWVDANENY